MADQEEQMPLSAAIYVGFPARLYDYRNRQVSRDQSILPPPMAAIFE